MRHQLRLVKRTLPNKALQLTSAGGGVPSNAAQSSLRSQAGLRRLAAGPGGLPYRSAALAAERRSVGPHGER
jgi:hypothetical protein